MVQHLPIADGLLHHLELLQTTWQQTSDSQECCRADADGAATSFVLWMAEPVSCTIRYLLQNQARPSC